MMRNDLCNWIKPLFLKRTRKLVDNLVWLSKTRSSFLEKVFMNMEPSFHCERAGHLPGIYFILLKTGPLAWVINAPQTKALRDPMVISFKNWNKSNTGWNSKSDTKSQWPFPSPVLTNCPVHVSSCLSNFWSKQRPLKALSLHLFSKNIAELPGVLERQPHRAVPTALTKAIVKQKWPPRAPWVLYSSKTR